jgi:hypothetical protein
VTLAACSSLATFPDGEPLEDVVYIPLHLAVDVEDSLRLRCPSDAPRDSAWHWISRSSLLRLEQDGTAELSILAQDRPPSRTGGFRCGDAGHEMGVLRPGRYGPLPDGVLEFTWDSVPTPDTAGVWVTSEEVWISDGIPAGGRELSTVLRFQEVRTSALLRFPVLPGG